MVSKKQRSLRVGTVRMGDSCGVSLGHIIFPADLATGFVHSPSLVQNAGECGRFSFSQSGSTFFFIAMNSTEWELLCIVTTLKNVTTVSPY